jgi:cytochrome c oxidase subunit 2
MVLGSSRPRDNGYLWHMGASRGYCYAWHYGNRSKGVGLVVLTSRSIEEWYKSFSREEKIWLILAIAVALTLAATTLSWHLIDPYHQVPTTSIEISPKDFSQKVSAFMANYSGRVVPKGVDVYLGASQWVWRPSEIRLSAGVTYRVWVSSTDVLHGLSIVSKDGSFVYNVMVMPGMAYAIHIRFDKPGEYYIICNEYCGIGHQYMVGKIVVVG